MSHKQFLSHTDHIADLIFEVSSFLILTLLNIHTLLNL